MQQAGSVRVDADGVTGYTARQARFAEDAADCVAELRAGGFGQWWRDGRDTGLAARLDDLAYRLEAAADGVGEVSALIRRQGAEVATADADLAHGLDGVS